MRLQVVVRRLLHPVLVECEFRPRWWEVLLGYRSYTRFAVPIYAGASSWHWDDSGGTIDDATMVAIDRAIAEARLEYWASVRQRDADAVADASWKPTDN